MTTTFQIVNPDDTSQVLFDFNGTNGTDAGSVTATFGVGGGFDLGVPERRFSRFEPGNRSGALTAWQRDGLAEMRWKQQITATTYDNLVTGLSYLQRLLAAGGVIAYAPDGATNTRYIEFEPSPAAAFLNGKELELWHAVQAFKTHPDGVELRVMRQPYLKGDELDPATNIALNSSLLVNGSSTYAPHLWAWDSTSNISSGTAIAEVDAFGFDIATTSTRNLQQTTATGSVGNSQAWTFSVYAKVASGTNARLTAAFQPLQSGGSNNGSEFTSTQTTLTTSWQRISVTGTTPATLTSKAKLSIRMANSSGTQVTVYIRYAQFELGGSATVYRTNEQTVSNNPYDASGRTLVIYNPGDAPAEGILTITGESGPTTYLRDVYTALRSGTYLTDYINTRKYLLAHNADQYLTDTTDTAVASDDSSDGTTLITDSTAGTSNMARRFRFEVSSDLEVLRGKEWHVWARVRTGGSADKIEARLNWATGDVDPAPLRNDLVTLDYSTTSGGGTEWTEMDLGAVQVPANCTTLALDVWARCVSGSEIIYWDALCFAPVDEQVGTISAAVDPAEVFYGDDLNGGASASFSPGTLTNGAVVGARYQLTDNNDACGTPPNSGSLWGVGQHLVYFNIGTSEGTDTVTFSYRARNITTGSHSGLSISKTVAGGVRSTYGLLVDVTSAANYQPQVVRNSSGADEPDLNVHWIGHRYVAGLSSGQSMVSDADTYYAERQSSSGASIEPLDVSGNLPVIVPPGLSVLYLHFLENPSTLSEVGLSYGDRAPTVGIAFAPRYYA